MDNSERILLIQIQKSNKDVFKHIYLKYYDVLVRFAFGHLKSLDESKDVVQSVFLKFWQDRKSIKVSISLKSYLFKSVNNQCLNKLRDLRIRDKNHLLFANLLLADISQEPENSDLQDEVHRALEQLPDQIKAVLRKRYFHQMKNGEIAEDLNISINTVKTQLQRGRDKLRVSLKKKTD